MGDITLKQFIDLIPTIGVVGAILAFALWLGNRRIWVNIWVYDEMKKVRDDRITELALANKSLKEEYDTMRREYIELVKLSGQVADKALDAKEKK